MSSDKEKGPSTFRLKVELPKRVEVRPPAGKKGVGSQLMDREEFCGWVSAQLSGRGLLGVHEGTLLTPEAAEQGLETESWTVDAGEAPRERDWVGSQSRTPAEFYFDTRENAERARKLLEARAEGVRLGAVEEQEAQDWDAKWKASFLASADGVRVPPCWRILPPWVEAPRLDAGERVLRINPGAGFGTGTHETTQLCLGAIAERSGLKPGEAVSAFHALDFGSGSGILSIGAALLGAEVDAVEIDALANENALENARLNGVESLVAVHISLEDCRWEKYPLVIANILKPVLLEFAERLVARMAPGGTLVLSGLIAADVAPVTAAYAPLLGGVSPEVRERGEWRCLVWAQR